ncbi:hypothetical protein EDC56_2843 [Sinobacterium caligoides]|uniref:Uncharacterized protein n=1 Tax=Sinobacterium caligoides TaxID=933926 RepID=A0A3N2DLH5_9GAMM|nr:hypothetical protein EDC56_2843 [Sinobacterium caligoides]
MQFRTIEQTMLMLVNANYGCFYYPFWKFGANFYK